MVWPYEAGKLRALRGKCAVLRIVMLVIYGETACRARSHGLFPAMKAGRSLVWRRRTA